MTPTRRELWEKALSEGPRLRKLALLLLDYIDLLSAELDETAPIAHLHGWVSTRVEEGNRLRAAIENPNKSNVDPKLKVAILSEQEATSLKEGGFFKLVIDHPRFQIYLTAGGDEVCVWIPERGMVQISNS